MSTWLDRSMDRWADQNVAGKGRNAMRFLAFVAAAGLCVALGVISTRHPALLSAVGPRGAALVALVLILPSIALLGLAMVCLIMSLMNAMRTGKLG